MALAATLSGGMVCAAMSLPLASCPSDAPLQKVFRGLRDALDLAEAAAADGERRDAAEVVTGAIDDLGPELAILRSLLTP